MIYRIRVDLDNSWPPIWRRLDVRSDAKLDVVHQVVQAAFGWEDRHLYRFSLGGDPLDATSESREWPVTTRESVSSVRQLATRATVRVTSVTPVSCRTEVGKQAHGRKQ